MDDLDHSMHIAEYDWTSFYDESEECGLQQPSLACPDNASLSDSEDSGNSSSVFSTGLQEPEQSPAANGDEAKSNAEGCCRQEVQNDPSGSGGERDDLSTKAEEGSTIIAEETSDDVTTTLQTEEQLNVQSSDGESTELKKEDGDVQTESDSSTQEPDPLSCSQTELNVNELQTADRAVSEDVGGVALRAEKERWFVTVNDRPARQRVRGLSVKKKRRQKKPRKDNHMSRTPGQERLPGNELEIRKDDNESEGGRDTEYYVTQSNQNLKKKSGGHPSAEENPESVQMGVFSDSSQMSLTSGEEDDLSEKLATSRIIEPKTDRSKHDTFAPSRLDSVESDGVEFFSTHSYDSESYLSAAESVEEPQHPLMEHQQSQSSLSLTKSSYLFDLTENTDADDTQDRETRSCDSTLSCNVTATDCEGYECADAEPTLTFPSAGQSADKMPDDNSTCDNDTRSTPLGMPSDTPGLQKHEINLSAFGCSSGDGLSLLPVPDVTVTPCPVADSPETCAQAAGHARPVFAISAFWDEMEKLTINDILQLRMGGSTPPRETQETATPNDDSPTNHSSLADPGEYNLSDGGLMDTSDTTDSDYFTQPDESKPDCSSCDFSTSDFEEEYWQFLGASRNPSPDLESKSQQRTSDSPFFTREEEESTSSEGKDTPVPLEDFAGECFEDQDSNAFVSSEHAWPRQIRKTKSVRNVQALNTEDLSLQLLLGNDESSLFLSSCPPLEENNLGIPALDEHTQISFPKVFEYFFTQDKAVSQCVYDPDDISVAPVFDYTLCTFRDETSLSSLCGSQCSEEKPIPIFSCSHPTVRELTFPSPGYVFLSANCEEEDCNISPIRVVSRSFILGSDCGTSEFRSWKSLLSIRKIRFHDKGSIWCRGSGAWVFPIEAEKITIKTADPLIPVLTEGRVSSTPSQVFEELAVQQRILETIQTTSKSELSYTLHWM